MGDSVSWVSSAEGKQFSISGKRSNLKTFTVSDPIATKARGCIVEICEINKDFEIRATHGFVEKLRDVFALQLFQDPTFSIVYDGERVDARESIRRVTPYNITAFVEQGDELTGELEVVEWNKRVERKLMLCLPGRFSFHDMAPGIHARGFEFTAYLTSDYFQKLADENTEELVELDKGASALIEACKAKLREHFRAQEAQRSRYKIQEWQEAKIYPYEGHPIDAIEINERQLFDVVALNLSDYSQDFERSSPKQQKLVLQLVKAAIESGPTSLKYIFENVIELPQAKQDEMAELLRKTSLTAVINAAKAVTDRLDFLKALQILVFDPKSKRQLLERSQLHRILAQETWIFGEQFNLMNDDEDLTSVLRAHLRILGKDRDNLAPVEPVVDADGNTAVVDLMLSCRVPTPTDNERRHLVVELKRPAQSINEDVVTQIKRYAKAVALDDRFKHPGVEWDFVAVSNRMTEDAQLEARQSGKPRGLVFELDDPKMRVWIKPWSEIIAEAEGRLTFYKRRLEYAANDTEAIRYLKTIKADYLSEEVKAKIAALEDAG
ncbi:hypothetical protein [Methylocystis iwaonis]|uniref:ATP-binding protein n=1 Tax=Methylocystis iwaonis TaxID=2885079 RepID=A0ABM8E821_9HYPH|nr:hypothetical protein [Methylocystis iwaonis]BDV34119.1 hypothetical protein SS37A_16480 [Methylocystis iwaonis]